MNWTRYAGGFESFVYYDRILIKEYRYSLGRKRPTHELIQSIILAVIIIQIWEYVQSHEVEWKLGRKEISCWSEI